MNTATIEVQYAEPPKAGKKQGTVKATTGEIFGIWPDKLGLMRPGHSYEIEFSDREFNGRTYRTIVKCKPHKGAKQPAAAKPAVTHERNDSELEFVARVLSAAIQACAVEYTQAGLTGAARMLRTVYQEAFK